VCRHGLEGRGGHSTQACTFGLLRLLVFVYNPSRFSVFVGYYVPHMPLDGGLARALVWMYRTDVVSWHALWCGCTALT